MKSIYKIIVLIFLSNNAISQIRTLKINSVVPNVKITSLLNYPTSTANYSQFKNKLIILDFFTTGCRSCIEAIPNFSILQKKYDSQIQIFLVTYQSAENVKKFLLNHKTILPIISEDTIFSKLFPHVFIPHEVWIKNGIVKAMTSAEYVKDENIQALLKGEKITWKVKTDINDFDYDKSLLTINTESIPEQSLPSVVFYSSLTP
ncbi:MAG: redoxin domain-containing protein, partial [Chitinophagaceae bacterium]|nr:redoxin domain-containing protein [Chitinophagaceae bacterium]